MSDNTELKQAAQRIVEVQTSQDVPIGILFDEFEALASPEAILALIADNEAMAKRIFAIDVVRGPKAELRWSALAVERDQLKADSEALHKDAERYRWLRLYVGAFRTGDGLGPVSVYPLSRPPATESVSRETDAAVDAAIGKGQHS